MSSTTTVWWPCPQSISPVQGGNFRMLSPWKLATRTRGRYHRDRGYGFWLVRDCGKPMSLAVFSSQPFRYSGEWVRFSAISASCLPWWSCVYIYIYTYIWIGLNMYICMPCSSANTPLEPLVSYLASLRILLSRPAATLYRDWNRLLRIDGFSMLFTAVSQPCLGQDKPIWFILKGS